MSPASLHIQALHIQESLHIQALRIQQGVRLYEEVALTLKAMK